MKKIFEFSNKQVIRKASIIAGAVAAALALPPVTVRKLGLLKPEMILDSQLMFSDSQAVTADAVGTNVIDLSSDRSIGNGEPMGVLFVVEVAADQTTGDEDYTFDVEYASDAAQTTGRKLIGRRVFESGTPTAPAEDADLLVAGFKFVIPIPMTQLSESERFLGIRYDVTGTTPTITVSAYLMPLSMIEVGQVSYPSGFSVL